MPYRTIKGRRVFVHKISPEHPSGHGAISEEQNNAFIAGVKYQQAKERYEKNMNQKTGMTMNKAKEKYLRLQNKYHNSIK